MTPLTRRRALFGLLAAPAIIRTAGLLMPVRPVALAALASDPIAPLGGYVRMNGRIYQITAWSFGNLFDTFTVRSA